MKKNKSWSSYVLLLILVSAFLTAQWATSHIHLADQHDHDGAVHQHQVEVHAHDLTIQFIDEIDVSHNESHVNIIELDPTYHVQKGERQKNNFTTIIVKVSIFQPPPSCFLARIKSPIFTNPKQDHLYLSITHPRAPPQSS